MVQIMIKVKAGDLLHQVRANRTKHEIDYLDATAGYWNKYEDRLKEALAQIALMKKPEDKGPDNPLHGLLRPQSHLDDYDLAISMLEQVEEDSDIELGSDQYKQLWLDEWDWKHHFSSTNSMYTSS